MNHSNTPSFREDPFGKEPAEAGLGLPGQVAGSGSSEPPAHSEELRPLMVSSDELLQGRRELWIEHKGELYRLRVTSAGKLYMTK